MSQTETSPIGQNSKKGKNESVPKIPFLVYAIYNIPNTIVNIANMIDNITVHLFCFPSFVLLLFFSKKLLVDEPVIVEDSPESSFDCINTNMIDANAIIKYITINIHFAISMFYLIPFSELKNNYILAVSKAVSKFNCF